MLFGVGAAVALAVSAGCTGEVGSGDDDRFADFDEVEVELPDGSLVPAELVYFDNDRGEELFGVFATPETSGPWPAVIILHGSGGLFSTPDSNDTMYEVPEHFAEWTKLLIDRGYAVLFPSSFASRGYLEQHESTPERLIMRVYDAYGALDYMCGRSDIECDRIAAMGFSNGASASAVMLHDRVGDIEGMGQLRADRPSFQFSCAYYPGCGFQGLVSPSLDDPAEFYRPSAPVWIYHGAEDGLVDGCEERMLQIDRLVELGEFSEPPVEMVVYDGAGHGFDSPDGDDELAARDQARASTLDILDSRL